MADNRGGARPNAGRKAKSEDEARCSISFRVDPVTRDRIQVLKSKGMKIGIEIDKMVEKLVKDLGLE